MKLKRFNQLNEGKFDDFIEEVKKVVNYDESEYEQGDEHSNVDLLSEVGELMNKYELTTADLQQIVDDNPNDWEIQTYVGPQLDYDLSEKSKKDKLFNDIKNIIINNKNVDKAVSEIIQYFQDYEKN